jgi:hypothetical protein
LVIQCTIESEIAGYRSKPCFTGKRFIPCACLTQTISYAYSLYSSQQGTIIAQGGNDAGIVGVIPDNNNICLLIARVFGDAEGGVLGSSVNAAMEWCGENDARVINMSLGTGFYSRTQQVIIRDLEVQGVLVVAAAGNDGTSDLNYPAGYTESISVGAVDRNLAWASFSQFNSQVDVCAPGVRILSTVPTIAIFDNSNDAKYDASFMDGSAILPDILEGDLADCGLALERCENVSGKICLIERGEIAFAAKATNCEDGGGIGLIIFNNVGSSDVVSGTLGGIEVGIPVLSISRYAGLSFSLASLPSVKIDVRSADYRQATGTSMAAPHVTGVIARIWSVRLECTSAQVREAVENSALDLGDAGRDDRYGEGLVQMEAAYEYLLSLDAPCGRVGAVEDSTDLPTTAPTKKPSNAPTKAPGPSPADIFSQTNESTGDEAVTNGPEDLSAAKDDGQGDAVSNSIASFSSSAYNSLPSVGHVAIPMLMAILLTVV